MLFLLDEGGVGFRTHAPVIAASARCGGQSPLSRACVNPVNYFDAKLLPGWDERRYAQRAAHRCQGHKATFQSHYRVPGL